MVGYQTKTLTNVGYNFFTPTFKNVSGQVINLQDIVPVGAMGDQSEFIMKLDEDGLATDESYCWMTVDGCGAPYGDGWYNGDTWELIEGVTIADGEGLYFYCPNDVSISFTFSGAVDFAEKEVALKNQGYNIVGNASPVDVDLQSITMTDAMGDQSEFIVMYDEDGLATENIYCWMTVDGCGAPEGDGWYNGDTWEKIQGVTIYAGDAMMVYSPNTSSAKIKFPEINK